MNKIYFIAIDPYKTDALSLYNIITTNPYVITWWHYLESIYLIKSAYTLGTIQNDIIAKWPNQRFLIMEVNAHNFSGWLPKEAWDWINLHK